MLNGTIEVKNQVQINKENKKVINFIMVLICLMSFMLSAFAGSNLVLYILLISIFIPFIGIFFHALSINIYYKDISDDLLSGDKIGFTSKKLLQSAAIFLVLFLLISQLPVVNPDVVFSFLGNPLEIGLVLFLSTLNLLSTIPTIIFMFTYWIIVKDFDYKIQRVKINDNKALKGILIFSVIYILKFVSTIIYIDDTFERELQGIEFLEGKGHFLLIIDIILTSIYFAVFLYIQRNRSNSIVK